MDLWVGGMTSDLLLSRGWTPLVTATSIGIALVIFALGQHFSIAKEWPDYRKKIPWLAPHEVRRHIGLKRYLQLLADIEVFGAGYFVSLPLLLFLYSVPEPSQELVRLAVFTLVVPTFVIALSFLHYRLFRHRLH